MKWHKTYIAIFSAALLLVHQVAVATVSQYPLFLVNSVDPNVLFNMSIESPMGGAAYSDQRNTAEGCSGRKSGLGICYLPEKEYLGYFNSKLCYDYDDKAGYFKPSNNLTNSKHECSGQYSGNFMNWATMTAMDMFVWTMTGGNRIIDKASNETVIKRARKVNKSSWFPQKWLVDLDGYNVDPSTVTPFSDRMVFIYNTSYGAIFTNKYIDSDAEEQIDHDNDAVTDEFDEDILLKVVNIQVQVCDKNTLLEDNCVAYDSGKYYKPEGLIQKNAANMRFAVTSYSNSKGRQSPGTDINGGILRSNMKYVGPTMPDGSGNLITNPYAEIKADGTFNTNPNPDDAEASTGAIYSGVIPYINKFSDDGYKTLDPASELFYESIRYYRNLGPTPEYLDGVHGSFPELASNRWQDPIQYHCQSNFIVGINDANPWKDKMLPNTYFKCTADDTDSADTFNGREITGDCGPPSNSANDIDVTAHTNKVGELEGLNGTQQCIGCTATSCKEVENKKGKLLPEATAKTIPGLGEVFGTCPSPQKDNTYYIAGLAYYANTEDIRPDLKGEQHIKTFMIDTQEYNAHPLIGPMNMLWLAGKYGGFTDENGDKDPNNDSPPTHNNYDEDTKTHPLATDSTSTSEWDADGDYQPDNYILATSPENLVTGLNRAFSTVINESASASSVATSSTRVDTDTLAYQARFNSGNWSGQLLAYKFDKYHNLEAFPEWDAADKIPAAENRKIFTYDTDSKSETYGEGIAFSFDDLNDTQIAYLNKDAYGVTDSEAEQRVNYLRGDDLQEGEDEGDYRIRTSLLGDVVNSEPTFFNNKGRFGYSRLSGEEGSSYINYRKSKQSESPAVVFGSNDGMLHAINADTGSELFTYVPDSVFPNLSKLSSRHYGCTTNGCITHQYFVDGKAIIGDAYVKTPHSELTEWRSILIGTLGAGGKGVFALDVSHMDEFSSSDVLWEIHDNYTPEADDLKKNFSLKNNLGYTLAPPSLVRVNYKVSGKNVGKWIVVLSNGYDSNNHKAVLYIIDVETGEILRELDTKVGSSASPNGMSTPLTVDYNDDKITDAIYAGDLHGNLWKIDVSDSDASKWDFSFKSNGKPAPLFIAKDSDGTTQPITAQPQSATFRDSGVMVFVGTGQYYAVNDQVVGDSPQLHSFYGIKDKGVAVESRESLQAQTMDYVGVVKSSKNRGDKVVEEKTIDVVVTSDNTVSSSQYGWYMDLVLPEYDEGGNELGAQGARVVHTSQIRSGRIIFTVVTPEADPCQYGGTSFLMELKAESGSRLMTSPVDLNGDGEIDELDLIVTYDMNGDGEITEDEVVAASGLSIHDLGMIGKVTILTDEDGNEIKILNGNNGEKVTIKESAADPIGRKSWHQLR